MLACMNNCREHATTAQKKLKCCYFGAYSFVYFKECIYPSLFLLFPSSPLSPFHLLNIDFYTKKETLSSSPK